MWGKCDVCGGSGSIYVEDAAKLQLQTWIIHPRKGCSRGILVEDVKQEDLPAALVWLRNAAKRNADRFSKLEG